MQTLTARDLSAYELEILQGVDLNGKTETVSLDHWDGSGTYEAQVWVSQAYIVYTDEQDGICFGPVRAPSSHWPWPPCWPARRMAPKARRRATAASCCSPAA